jgi:thymidine phosphorylase
MMAIASCSSPLSQAIDNTIAIQEAVSSLMGRSEADYKGYFARTIDEGAATTKLAPTDSSSEWSKG